MDSGLILLSFGEDYTKTHLPEVEQITYYWFSRGEPLVFSFAQGKKGIDVENKF